MLRRKGFTLIELLVVIAIIGILAAMLFPVFARARESARKTQCLANVKNIAIAINMYLTDYDKLMPSEHRAEVIDAFNGGGPNIGSCGCGNGRSCCTDRVTQPNPYLKAPVILDDYVKNRDVWRCPSAYYISTYPILNPYHNSRNADDWWLTFVESQSLCPKFRSCSSPFPPGWGGACTDMIGSGLWCTPDAGTGAFEQSIGVPQNYDLATSAMTDPAKWVVVADAGANAINGFDRTSAVAYPDMCRIDTVGCNTGCGGDWANCSQSQECSPLAQDHGGTTQPASDVNYRKTHYHSRHLGGSNVGFADGHAKWSPSEAILFGGQNWSGFADGTEQFANLGTCFNPTNAEHP